jgi:hypothetical protein
MNAKNRECYRTLLLYALAEHITLEYVWFTIHFFASNSNNKMKTFRRSRKTKTIKRFLYNPQNPKKSFDVYIDKDPSDTIPIKYKTIDDVRHTINKLERLYKAKKYSHKRIWQVGMIMKVRLEALKAKKSQEYNLSKKYFDFLSHRTKLDEDERYKSIFA